MGLSKALFLFISILENQGSPAHSFLFNTCFINSFPNTATAAINTDWITTATITGARNPSSKTINVSKSN